MEHKKKKTDFLIIGGGIIGLTISLHLKRKKANSKVILIEKENDLGVHASGRNSGVLHAGFYYFPDSLKSRFTRDGNEEMKRYCESKGIKINKCGKVVVAKSEEEIQKIYSLKERGDKNNVETYIIDEKELNDIEPNAKTLKYALWSPNTATVNPKEVIKSIAKDAQDLGVEIITSTPYKKKISENTVLAGDYIIEYEKLVNTAGLYADKIAKDFGLSKNYILVPFKGIYFEYERMDLKRNIYPVPSSKNPFLGVHFTVGVDGKIKVGPNAIPCFWRENYKGLEKFKISEFYEIIKSLNLIFAKNKNFRETVFEEIRKFQKRKMLDEAKKLVKYCDTTKFKKSNLSGIRAQLIDVRNFDFVYDFVIESDSESIHVLNSVSPAFTASFPFSRFVVEEYILKDK